MPLKDHRIPGLDALRGLAAVGVAVYHYHLYFNVGPDLKILYPIYYGATFFVDLFFVLSGYLLTHVYAHISSYRELVIRRIARLFPLQWLTLFIVAGAQYFYSQAWGKPFIYNINDTYHFLLNVFLFQQTGLQKGFSFNGPSWSISVEWIINLIYFYLLIRPRMLFIFSFIFALISVVILARTQAEIVRFGTSLGFIDNGILRCGFGFFSGVIYANISKKLYFLKNNWLCDLLALVCGILFLLFLASKSVNTIFYIQVFVIGFLLPVLVISCSTGYIGKKVLSIRPLIWLGDISYAIYLVHFPIFIGIFGIRGYLPIPLNSGEGLILYVMLILLISHVVFNYFERPSQKYVRNLLKNRLIGFDNIK